MAPSATATATTPLEERYKNICDALGMAVDTRPTLVKTKPVDQGGWVVLGSYNGWRHTINASDSADDYLIVHELIHAVCKKELCYHGSHGLTFLVLHDIVMHYHFSDEPLDGYVVSTQWSRLASSHRKDRALKKAREISCAIIKEISAQWSRTPTIHEIAALVRSSEAGRYCFDWRKNPSALLYWFDRALTQKQAVFDVTFTVLFVLSIVFLLLASFARQQLGSVHESIREATHVLANGLWAAGIVLLASSVIFLYLVHQWRNAMRRWLKCKTWWMSRNQRK